MALIFWKAGYVLFYECQVILRSFIWWRVESSFISVGTLQSSLGTLELELCLAVHYSHHGFSKMPPCTHVQIIHHCWHSKFLHSTTGSVSLRNFDNFDTATKVSIVDIEISCPPETIKKAFPLSLRHFFKALQRTSTGCVVHFLCWDLDRHIWTESWWKMLRAVCMLNCSSSSYKRSLTYHFVFPCFVFFACVAPCLSHRTLPLAFMPHTFSSCL